MIAVFLAALFVAFSAFMFWISAKYETWPAWVVAAFCLGCAVSLAFGAV